MGKSENLTGCTWRNKHTDQLIIHGAVGNKKSFIILLFIRNYSSPSEIAIILALRSTGKKSRTKERANYEGDVFDNYQVHTTMKEIMDVGHSTSE